MRRSRAPSRSCSARRRERGQWLGKDAEGTIAPSGFIVLAMGKGGAGELNYSSDVDLIVFYDLDRIALAPGVEPAEVLRAA